MSGKDGRTPGGSERSPRLQPRWFIVLFWKVHRALARSAVAGLACGAQPSRFLSSDRHRPHS
jgi:hypothetical protein